MYYFHEYYIVNAMLIKVVGKAIIQILNLITLKLF